MKYFFILCLFFATCVEAQPPAQLPSLLDGSTIQMPVLHKNEDPLEFIKKNIFVKVTASKNTVFAGEPILVTYKLFTSLNSHARVSKQPSFTGCSVMELSTDNEPPEVTLNGKLFHVYVIRKVQVIPLQEGTLQLGPAYVDNVVQLIRDDGSDAQDYSTTLGNDTLNIQVKPLPLTDRPKDFSGVVGEFSIIANVDTNKIPAGEDAKLQVTIRGKGNIMGVHVPAIQWPQGTEHFDGSDTQRINQDNFPVSGYKTFAIPFIGDKEGSVSIAPVSFSYFDWKEEKYKTITTQTIPVEFTKAISRTQLMKDVVTEDITNKKYLWIVAAIGALVVVALIISSFAKPHTKKPVQVNAEKQKEVEQKNQLVLVNSKNPMEVFAELNDLGKINVPQKFFSSARIFLMKALQSKLEAACETEHDLVILLKENDNYIEIASSCETIFDTCNRNLYSPLGEDDIREKIYFELTAVVKKIYAMN
jgi:hypothetical protein